MDCYGCGLDTNMGLTGISVWVDGKRYPAVLCADCIARYRQCHECGSPIPDTARADARFCSSACRQRAYRSAHPRPKKPVTPRTPNTGLPPADDKAAQAIAREFVRAVFGSTTGIP